VDFKKLELKAKEIDHMTNKLKDLETSMIESQNEDLNYFG
jgi:proteasome assembly chaperone (PAC2) family protein